MATGFERSNTAKKTLQKPHSANFSPSFFPVSSADLMSEPASFGKPYAKRSKLKAQPGQSMSNCDKIHWSKLPGSQTMSNKWIKLAVCKEFTNIFFKEVETNFKITSESLDVFAMFLRKNQYKKQNNTNKIHFSFFKHTHKRQRPNIDPSLRLQNVLPGGRLPCHLPCGARTWRKVLLLLFSFSFWKMGKTQRNHANQSWKKETLKQNNKEHQKHDTAWPHHFFEPNGSLLLCLKGKQMISARSVKDEWSFKIWLQS